MSHARWDGTHANMMPVRARCLVTAKAHDLVLMLMPGGMADASYLGGRMTPDCKPCYTHGDDTCKHHVRVSHKLANVDCTHGRIRVQTLAIACLHDSHPVARASRHPYPNLYQPRPKCTERKRGRSILAKADAPSHNVTPLVFSQAILECFL